MTRETRIGLLVGLMFIIMFGLVLSELAGTDGVVPPPPRGGDQDAADGPPGDGGEITTFCVMPLPPARKPPRREVAPARDSSVAGVMRPRETVAAQRVASGGDLTTPVPTPGVYPDRKSDREMLAAMTHGARPSPRPSPRAGPRPIPPPAAAPPVPPPVTPKPPVKPPVTTYRVRKEDSLIVIARKVYGPTHWKEYMRIYEANRDILTHAGKLRPKQVLKIPPLPADIDGRGSAPEMTIDQLGAALADSSQPPADALPPPEKRLYKVRRGDNLTKIARKMLDDDSWAAVQRIAEANRSKIPNPNVLPVGTTLMIPI